MSQPPSGQKLNACRIESAPVLVHPLAFNPTYMRPPSVGTNSNHPPFVISCSLTAPASGHPSHPEVFDRAAPLTVTFTVAVQATGPDGFDPPVASGCTVTAIRSVDCPPCRSLTVTRNT